jgi:hypothetical protein
MDTHSKSITEILEKAVQALFANQPTILNFTSETQQTENPGSNDQRLPKVTNAERESHHAETGIESHLSCNQATGRQTVGPKPDA